MGDPGALIFVITGYCSHLVQVLMPLGSCTFGDYWGIVVTWDMSSCPRDLNFGDYWGIVLMPLGNHFLLT